MMRSMFSGVSGLKTHQTKMDVIGNNIANVNTTGYKSASITFSDLMYQTTSKASGPNAATGRAGINARQIGLGVLSGAITNQITTPGANQTTGNPFDVKINGDAFFVVSDGVSNYFTRDGSFYVDAAGNLAMRSNGYNVMGWGVDEETQTIRKDTVQALRIMSAANMTYPPEATTEAYVDGILDRNEPDALTSAGKSVTLNFFDALGYGYTARFSIHATETKGEYTVQLDDILDSEGKSLVDVYGVNSIEDIASFGGSTVTDTTELMQLVSGVTYDSTATPPIYTKEAALDEVFSDYATKRLSGVTYVPNGLAAGAQVAAGATVNMTGTGTVSKEDLENIYGLVYNDNGDGTHTWHHKDAATGNMVPVGNTAADWQAVLNKGNITQATIGADGSVSFTLTQDFTVGEAAATYSGNGGIFTIEISQADAYGLDDSDPNKTYAFDVAPDGQAQVTTTTTYFGHLLRYNVDNGNFISINGNDSVLLDFNASATTKAGATVSLASFSDINVDWTNTTWFNNGGSSTIGATSGTEENGSGAGRKLGQMSGIAIQDNGEIYATYDNGMNKLLGQIAAAKFANPSGLEKAGDNLYAATLNSGEFDGIGVDITADGDGSFTTGCLEMSNVDLSSEFTEMITTQRGFQANSRIITVSDTLLEELVNLKR